MDIVLAAATALEIQPALDYLRLHFPSYRADRYELPGCRLHIIIAGVGTLHATHTLTRRLMEQPADLLLFGGVAGSFNRGFPLGTVGQVVCDTPAESGAEAADGTPLSLFDLGLCPPDEPPYREGLLQNDLEPMPFMPVFKGITVGQASGTAERIARLHAKYPWADIETLEGAAAHYVCALHRTKLIHLRALSNYVEPRNREAWQLPLAVERLNGALIQILESFRSPSES